MSSSINIRSVDLHVHTCERSPCAINSEEEQIRAAIAVGLDAIFITDHHRLVPAELLEALNRSYAPFRIFGGIEVTSQGEDFIILGLQDPVLESSNWSYPELHAYVRAQGGFMVLAHPFRYRDQVLVNLDQFPADAIEVHSPNTPVAAEARIRDLADRLRVPVLCNSDAHSTERLGAYFNILDEPAADEAAIFDYLRAGRFRCQNCPATPGGTR